MSKKLNAFFVIALILFSMFPVQAAAPITYNKELSADTSLVGALFTDGDSTGFYASYVGDNIQITSTNHYTDKTIKIKGTALTNRLKMYDGLKVGYTHIADDGTVTHEIKSLVIDNQGFAYLTADFSTVIISGMTGTTTTTHTAQSGNQSFSVPDGSSYDLNITNNQLGLVNATGGTITTNGTDNIHTFLSNGTFIPDSEFNVEVLVVAGGGGGGGFGGGGGGGYRTAEGHSVTPQSYSITVGSGGAGGAGSVQGTSGINSIFDTITSAGGGGGGAFSTANSLGVAGGSGGGGGTDSGSPYTGRAGGAGDTPDVSPDQGYAGGSGATGGTAAGGGGGASEVGGDGVTNIGGDGGDGTANTITGSSVYYAGGGGGGGYIEGAPGGLGGGGDGKKDAAPAVNPTAGEVNTGGGGGGGYASPGGAGGSGIVIIRYNTSQGEVEVNITASITGDNNTQSYNTSQSKAFTLTPTATTSNVIINTTSTDYDITITTYWTEDTTLQSETATAGYAKQYINYTPSSDITSADLNTTFTFVFADQDYIGTATSTLNDVSKPTTRAGQDINASVGSLTADTAYYWNITVPYNNVFTLSNQSDQTASVGVSKAFTDSDYSDPEGLAIDTRLWNFGDGDTSAASNPSHIYTTVGTFKANYTVTETATVSPQTLTREFNVTVTLQPPQNLATTTTTESINVSWDSYASADKYSVYIQSDTMIYTAVAPTIDGIKGTAWDNAYHLIVPTPNPLVYTDYDTIDIIHDDDYVYIMAEMKDADTNANDDYAEVYFDFTKNGLTTDDRAWKMKENGDIQRLKWSGSAWISAGVTQADSAATGSGTNNIIVEMRIPIALFNGNIYEGALIPMLIERECTALNPDVESYHPIGNINNSDVSLWEDVYITNQTEHTTFIANTTNTTYNITGLDYFEWYKVGVTAWNGTTESTHSHTPAITDNLPSWSVSGHVKDQSGVGIAGATVWFHGLFVSDRTQTDIDGYYIRHMGDYNYTMYANKTAYQENSTSVNVFGANLTNQNITLQAFVITDWEIYQLLLDIQEGQDGNTTVPETTQPQNSMPLPLFIVWTLILIGLFYVAYPKRDDEEDLEIGIKNITASFISLILAFTLAKISINGQLIQTYSGISAINTVVTDVVIIQIGWLSWLFTFIGITMVILTIYLLVSEYNYRYGDDEDE